MFISSFLPSSQGTLAFPGLLQRKHMNNMQAVNRSMLLCALKHMQWKHLNHLSTTCVLLQWKPHPHPMLLLLHVPPKNALCQRQQLITALQKKRKIAQQQRRAAETPEQRACRQRIDAAARTEARFLGATQYSVGFNDYRGICLYHRFKDWFFMSCGVISYVDLTVV